MMRFALQIKDFLPDCAYESYIKLGKVGTIIVI